MLSRCTIPLIHYNRVQFTSLHPGSAQCLVSAVKHCHAKSTFWPMKQENVVRVQTLLSVESIIYSSIMVSVRRMCIFMPTTAQVRIRTTVWYTTFYGEHSLTDTNITLSFLPVGHTSSHLTGALASSNACTEEQRWEVCSLLLKWSMTQQSVTLPS